jgi:hypothetical protein
MSEPPFSDDDLIRLIDQATDEWADELETKADELETKLAARRAKQEADEKECLDIATEYQAAIRVLEKAGGHESAIDILRDMARNLFEDGMGLGPRLD